MRVFNDDQGLRWELSITVGAIRRVKAHLPEVDLLKIDEGDPPLQSKLTIDPVLVCECICAVLKPKLDGQNLSPDEFYERMAGPGLREGLAAFWGELDDFFLDLGRNDLSQLAKAQVKLLAEIVQNNASAIEAWEAQRQQLPKNTSTPGSSSTDSPGSPASTLTPAL